MVSENSENNYNFYENTDSCEVNSSDTGPHCLFQKPQSTIVCNRVQYSYHCKSIKGLNHLHPSADENYDNDTYLYGILMLCFKEEN